jgi:pimeloyl-ACP methyl ester carboxylesterase
VIRKGFVDLPHGQVHFRFAGKGPPLLLLHDSPRSSVMHEALIETLSDEFTAIAIDSPGYGQSDPLPAEPRPEIPDYAGALAATQAALGIDRCAIYGFHTSSKILLQFALDHPQRVGLAIIDGLNLPPGGPGDDFIKRYMKPLPLEADGSHLAAGWSRAREFMRFFPWFDTSPRARQIKDFPSDDYLHGYALDLLSAGPNYSQAYSAAMRYLATPLVARLQAPTVFMCRSNDPLFVFLDSLPQPLPAGCRIERLGPERAEWEARLRELFRSAVANTQPPGPPRLTQTQSSPQSTVTVRRRYRDVPGGQWHCRDTGWPTGRPLLILHAVPGSSAGVLDWLEAFAGLERPVWAPDLPGHGETAALQTAAGGAPTLENYADALAAFLEANSDQAVDIVAEFTAAPLALLAAARAPDRVRSLICDGIPLLKAGKRRELRKADCPPLAISRDGAHLMALWHRLRDDELCWPWYDGSAAAIRKVLPRVDTLRLHRLTLDVARQLTNYGDLARATWHFDLAPALAAVTQPVLLFKDANDPRLATSSSAKRRLPKAKLIQRPDSAAALAKAARAFWER